MLIRVYVHAFLMNCLSLFPLLTAFKFPLTLVTSPIFSSGFKRVWKIVENTC